MKLNIVMSAYNNVNITKIAYNSIIEHTDVPFKLTIVENNSTDDTRKWMETIDNINLSKVFPNKNVGGVGARNIGIDNLDSDAEYFVSVDNDIVATEKWASRMIDFM